MFEAARRHGVVAVLVCLALVGLAVGPLGPVSGPALGLLILLCTRYVRAGQRDSTRATVATMRHERHKQPPAGPPPSTELAEPEHTRRRDLRSLDL